MYDNPASLKDLCINVLCNNIEYFAVQNSEVYLHMDVSEILLTRFSLENKLNDQTLLLFSNKNVYLRNVILPIAKTLTTKGLRTLKNHKIKTLKVHELNCTVNELVGSLSEWTIQNLETLCISNSLFISDPSDLKFCVTGSLSKLKNLRSLDVCCTVFSTQNLITIVEDLPHLESLNISNTKVDTLLPLGKIRNKLQKLSVYNLKKTTMHSSMPHHECIMAFSALQSMTSLTHLDLSSEKCTHPIESFSCDTPWLQFLTDADWLPNLVSLDISGSDNVGPTIMEDFLTIHKKLRFLGLMHMDDCGLAMFTNPTHPLFNPSLEVTGLVTLEQLLAGIKRYENRPTYIQICLFNLFTLIGNYESPKVDIIQLILNMMDCIFKWTPILLKATSCLYTLTKSDLATKIHPGVLAKVVEVTLDIMERFPKHKVLLKNTLLTICNDHIIQHVKMDKVRCAKLVLNSLRSSNEDVINRMSVFIIIKLIAKLPTFESVQLGSNRRYIRKLLSIVSDKLKTKTADVTMKYTLAALWNLSDESPTTCEAFIDEGGLELYIDLLNTFISDNIVETRVLGLINNIAEVRHLRTELFDIDIIPLLRHLLKSDKINVSYFAAGIIAHLACEPTWVSYTARNVKDTVLEQLQSVIKEWVSPKEEMIIYKSLQPFIGLLKSTDTPEAQLWAAWAILHVCTKNAKKYVAMLNEENGIEIIKKIVSNKTVDPDLRKICYQILDRVNEFM